MQKFYKNAMIGLLCLLVVSLLVGYACVRSSYTHLTLLPAAESALIWRAEQDSDRSQNGRSPVKLVDAGATLSFDFTIVGGVVNYPFAAAAMLFRDRDGKPALVDLSHYSAISFDAKCAPANTVTLGILTFEDKVSIPGHFETYRLPSAFFSCNETWARVELDLTRLRTEEWWLNAVKLGLTKQAYKLDKVSKLNFGTTYQSPRDVPSRVQIKELTLTGRDRRYLYLLAAFLLLAWGGYALWFFKAHARALVGALRDKVQRDRPLVAYQQLSLELHRDKEKSTILRFLATEYANPDLDADAMVAATGINRSKINEILKAELGYTFSAYLNKLRLTEAARLLAEKEEASVAEIAYSVGYRNVSYFNKLFKEEYGCTPKTFRNLRDK